MKNRELKRKCKKIQELLDSEHFYELVCDQANNEIDKVIELLSRIINYMLYNDTNHIELDNIPNVPNNEILIYPTNMFYYRLISMIGLNLFAINRPINEELDRLNRVVSFYPVSAKENSLIGYYSIEESIKEAQSAPHTLFKNILKQPQGSELPITVGNSEISYYYSILEKRLKEAKTYLRTSTHVAEKSLNAFIGKDALLVLIPIEELKDSDLKKGIITEKVSNRNLSFISIPSRYRLLQICARNKEFHKGTKISIQNVEIAKKAIPLEGKQLVKYSRYEIVRIDDTFKYKGDLLTGDVNYDIDVIYGSKDTHETREKLAKLPDDNIRKIKSTSGINLKKIGDTYEVVNGRHRLVYMKSYFMNNIGYCRSKESEELLRDRCSVIANVSKTIEDPEVIRILRQLKRLIPNVKYLKENPLNDEINLVIIINNQVYIIEDKSSLINFYERLINKQSVQDYYIIKDDSEAMIDYNSIIQEIIDKLGDDFINLSFKDILEYINNNGIEIDGDRYQINTVDIMSFYSDYVFKINLINASRLTKETSDEIDFLRRKNK